MSILQKVFDALIGPSIELDPESAARETILNAGFSAEVQAKALARFERRMQLRQPVPDSLHAVMAWAEEQS